MPVSSESGRDVPCNERNGHVTILNGISEEENENCCGALGGDMGSLGTPPGHEVSLADFETSLIVPVPCASVRRTGEAFKKF